MKHTSIPPFYVGQEVVAVKDSKQGMPQKYKKGDVVQVAALKQSPQSGLWNFQFKGQLNIKWWLDCSRFAPITSTFQSITLEKVLEEETKLIGVN